MASDDDVITAKVAEITEHRAVIEQVIDESRAVRDEAITARSRFDEVLLGGPAPAVRGRGDVPNPAAN
jgi:hypothetical protein